MNKPIKGDSYRRGQYAHVMFQASANDVPDMRIKINEGSFWVNNKQLIEFNGGQSPVIEAPLSGAKWVLVAINKLYFIMDMQSQIILMLHILIKTFCQLLLFILNLQQK